MCCWLVLLYSFRHTMYGRLLLRLTIMLLVSVCPSAQHASVAATQVRYRAARQYAHAARQAAGRPDGAAFQDRAYQVAPVVLRDTCHLMQQIHKAWVLTGIIEEGVHQLQLRPFLNSGLRSCWQCAILEV